jgi:hypothetical protein
MPISLIIQKYPSFVLYSLSSDDDDSDEDDDYDDDGDDDDVDRLRFVSPEEATFASGRCPAIKGEYCPTMKIQNRVAYCSFKFHLLISRDTRMKQDSRSLLTNTENTLFKQRKLLQGLFGIH